ncbi:MAG: CBS domain-containing protein, partial [Thermoplasmata archaeon]
DENASINEAAKLMAKKGVKRLLVTRNNDELVGIITFTDIVIKVPDMLSLLEELVRPHHRKL